MSRRSGRDDSSSPRGNPAQASLPSKVCPVCGRPFMWRKKWQRDWEQVKYCSKACGKRGTPATGES